MWLNEKSVFPVILFLAVVILVVLVFSSNTYVPYSDDDIFHEFSVYEGMYEGFDEGFEEEFDDEGFEEGFEDEGFEEGQENKDTSAQPSKTVSDTTSVAATAKPTPTAEPTSVQTTPSAATAPESGSAPAPATKSGGTEPFGPYQLEYSPLTQSDSDKSALHYNPFKQGYAALNMSDKIDRFGAIVHAPQQGKCVSAELSTAHGPLCLTPELQKVMKTRGGNM